MTTSTQYAFNNTTPSLFVIVSPFQAICLVGAICNLGLSDYKVIVIQTDRFSQVKNVLEKYNILFEIRYVGKFRWRMRWYRLTSLIRRHNKYKRMFLGDFRSITLLYFGLQYASDGADIVYLDDGNATIPLFDDKRTTPPLGSDTKYAEMVCRLRRISFMKYFYSIYENLPNPKYEIMHNSLSILNTSRNDDQNKMVYIIGTNTKLYCESNNVSEDTIISVLSSTIDNIRQLYRESEIVYIPHGKDNSLALFQFCKSNSIEYKKLSVPVELFFTDECQPNAIYGFLSSALYNLKQMYPNTDVYNIYLPPKAGDSLARKKSISEYYKKCGIIQLEFEA